MGFGRTPKGTLQHLYNKGIEDPFISRMMFQFFEMKNFIFPEKDKAKEFDDRYAPILQNLLEALLVKDKCIELIARDNTI